MIPWRDEARRRDYHSCAVLRIKLGRNSVASLVYTQLSLAILTRRHNGYSKK